MIEEDELARALLQYRNTPCAKYGLSPVAYSVHPVQDTIPVHYKAFSSEWQQKMQEKDTRRSMTLEKAKRGHDKHAISLPEITVGSHVAVQNKDTKRFDIYAMVL